MPEPVSIAVIGGSGLYNMPEISDKSTAAINTPFGAPSADVSIGTLRGKRVAFLPRHGIGHVYAPSSVPYRANIYALKSLGVRFIIAVNACGSLRADYAPGNIVIPDQLFDYTKADRGRSFFGDGLVAHVGVADPFSPELSALLFDAATGVGADARMGGTFVIVEGPRFSTRGESHIYQHLGCSIIGMTSIPEAFLAREAEIAYATMAHVTDYDVWHTGEEPVTVEMVLKQFANNLQIAQQAVAAAVEAIDERALWPSHTALDGSITTHRESISPEMIEKLRPIVARTLGL
jgi:5'-methylthioadenosine phosphorylase